MLDFFFWAPGTREQKSQEGFLRALLYQITTADRRLIPLLLPDTWRDCYGREGSGKEPPSAAEMKEGLHKLATLETLPWKLFIILDGLDEFEGDVSATIALIEQLAGRPDIKILLPSRPMGLCDHAFGSCPQLRIQDLTRGDMSLYIDDELLSHPYVSGLEQCCPGTTKQLKAEILEKASGVFLWLVLACRTLRDGCASSATLADLRRRLEELPPELQDMFRHIVCSRVHPRYRGRAAKLLRIAFESQVLVDDTLVYALPLLKLDDQDLSLSTLPLPLRANAMDSDMLPRLERRLVAYTGGLLEVQALDIGGRHRDVGAVTVGFMHRTVYEYLASPEATNLDYLQLHDDSFDIRAILAFFGLDSALMRQAAPWAGADDEIVQCLRNASLASPRSWHVIDQMLQRVVDHYPLGRKERRSFQPVLAHVLASPEVVIAVEAGIAWYLQHHPLQLRWGTMVGADRYSLMSHVLHSRVLPDETLRYHVEKGQAATMISLLLRTGGSPLFFLDPWPGRQENLLQAIIAGKALPDDQNVNGYSRMGEAILAITEVVLDRASPQTQAECRTIGWIAEDIDFNLGHVSSTWLRDKWGSLWRKAQALSQRESNVCTRVNSNTQRTKRKRRRRPSRRSEAANVLEQRRHFARQSGCHYHI
jgi:hypothetical protein